MKQVKEHPQRTPLQNRSLHKYCTLLAQALNDAGLDAKKTLKPEIDIPWTPEMVKDLLFRPIMKAMTGKTSTTQLDTVEPSQIHAVLDLHTSEKFGIHVDWPSEENMEQEETKVAFYDATRKLGW